MLTIESVEKRYGEGTPVLHGVSLAVEQGEIVCLLGPSGCGKTTLLRIAAGLEALDRGRLLLDGADLTAIPVHRRNFGLMFQEFALFPHRTVAENVAFGLRMQGKSAGHIAQRVQEVLTLVDLAGYETRSVFELSGGERQRVALARSLAPSPRLLMLDEPLGSLDRTLRDELVTELRTILKQVDATAIYVTHDQQEAFAVADRLVVMRAGRLEQVDTPLMVYQQPATPFVARFLGLTNLIPVVPLSDNHTQLRTPFGQWAVPPALWQAIQANPSSQLLLRPDGVAAIEPGPARRSAADPAAAQPTLTATLTTLSFRGATYRLEVDVETNPGAADRERYRLGFDVPVGLIAPHLALLTVGEHVRLTIHPDALTVVG